MIKVVLTTNFSDSARNAMIYAIQLFGTDNTEYIIMNTMIDSPTGNDGFLSAEELTQRGDEQKLINEENFLRKVFPNKVLKFSHESVYGQLSSAINEVCEKVGANYVVIGNKKEYDIDASILRAKTYEVVEKIKCPVLAVPEGREFSTGEGGLIFASDMQTIKKPDHLEPLIRLAMSHNVPVTTIHVKKPTESETEEVEKAGTQLSEIFGIVPHEVKEVEAENAVDGISQYVSQNEGSLLIMLARKHNFFKRITSQSLTKEMSKIADTPILILHDY